jgi:hypothetical protein
MVENFFTAGAGARFMQTNMLSTSLICSLLTQGSPLAQTLRITAVT